jgi:hypothetical protein
MWRIQGRIVNGKPGPFTAVGELRLAMTLKDTSVVKPASEYTDIAPNVLLHVSDSELVVTRADEACLQRDLASKPSLGSGGARFSVTKGKLYLLTLPDQVGTVRRGGVEPAPETPGPAVVTPPPPKPKKPSVALPSLSQGDIVSAMKEVQQRVRDCYNQYKVPGVANVSISVSKGGRIASASVAGRFAGTPSGTCVEAAVKTARFPPREAINFPWPVQLH